MRRLLAPAEELLQWTERLALGDCAKYLGSLDCPCFAAGQVMVGRLWSCHSRPLRRCGFHSPGAAVCGGTRRVVESEFNYDELRFSINRAKSRGCSAQELVLCEGYKVSGSLFFEIDPEAPFASMQLIANFDTGEPIHPEFDVCRKSWWQ